MSTELIGVLGVVALLILLFLRFWIGIVLAFIGFIGFTYLLGADRANMMLGSEPFSFGATYVLSAIPLFILMGNIVSISGIAGDLYRVCRNWIGGVRGGLAMATVLACGGFAAVCGSSMATTATMGKVAYPEMIKHNYHPRLASAVISAGGTLGILIPPSIGFIIYGLFTETSIGKLFMAGILPGITEMMFYGVTIYIICLVKPHYAPSASPVPLREKVISLRSVWSIGLLFGVVIGGIYGGIFTPTEAGAVGAFGAIVIATVMRRINLRNLASVFRNTAETTAMLMILIAGSTIFNRFITATKLPTAMGGLITDLDLPVALVMVGIIVVYIVIGCFVDINAAIVLTLPVIFPIVKQLGFNAFWFGVIMVRMMEVGAITPPMGLNLFVLSKTIDVPVGTLYRSIYPFVIADFMHIAMLFAVPQISTFLVDLM